MVAEPLLDNTFFRSYNITKNFATFHSAGSTMYESTSTDSLIKTVSSKKDNDFFITLINSDSEPVNITLNVGDASINLLGDTDGNLHDLGTSTNLGILDSFRIQYLFTPRFSLTQGGDFEFRDFENTTLGTSPLVWFSLLTNSEIHIASNLSNTISSTVLVNIPRCSDVGIITYTPDSKSGIQTFNKNQFSCNGNTVTLLLNQIEPSTSSNVLTWTYGCSAFERTGYEIIRIAMALLLLAGVLFYTFKDGTIDELTVGKIILILTVVVVGIALLTGSLDIIAETCPV